MKSPFFFPHPFEFFSYSAKSYFLIPVFFPPLPMVAYSYSRSFAVASRSR